MIRKNYRIFSVKFSAKRVIFEEIWSNIEGTVSDRKTLEKNFHTFDFWNEKSIIKVT